MDIRIKESHARIAAMVSKYWAAKAKQSAEIKALKRDLEMQATIATHKARMLAFMDK